MAKFIVFEGLDNLGKTTQINLLKKILPADTFVFTVCPGGSESAKQIRSILADETARETMTSRTEVLLYAASHADVSNGVILPALQQDKHVICDRYYHSCLAYQGGLRGHPEEDLLLLHERFSGNLQPDIVFYFSGKGYNSTSEDNPGGFDGISQEKKKKISDMYDKHLEYGGVFQGEVIPIFVDTRSEQEIHAEILMHLREMEIFTFCSADMLNASTMQSLGDLRFVDIKTVGDLVYGLRRVADDSSGIVYITTKEKNKKWKLGEYGTDDDTIHYPSLLIEEKGQIKSNGLGKLDYYVTIAALTDEQLEGMMCYG